MIVTVLANGLWVGLIHFIVTGALYGNPVVDRIYQHAMATAPGVRKWPTRGRYLLTQFLGTQVEVYILALAFVLLRPGIALDGQAGAAALGVLLAAVRVYPRFWNMWIQSTYPGLLLAIEAINGIISTLVVTALLQFFLA